MNVSIQKNYPSSQVIFCVVIYLFILQGFFSFSLSLVYLTQQTGC